MPHTSRAAAVISGIVAAASCFWVWREHGLRVRAEGLLAQSNAEATRLNEDHQRPAPISDSGTRVLAVNPEPPADPVALQQFHQNLARRRAQEAKAGAAAQEAFVASPEIQERAARQMQANIGFRYAPMYRSLGWSEAEVRVFEGALLAKFWAMSDLQAAANATGAGLRAVMSSNNPQLLAAEEQFKAAVGGAYEAIRRYDQSADGRSLIDQFAGKAAALGAPLTDEQTAQLADIISANLNRPIAPDEWLKSWVFAGQGAALTWSQLKWDSVLAQAERVLSRPQLRALSTARENAEFRGFIDGNLRQVDNAARRNAGP